MRNDLSAPRDLDSVQRTALLLVVAAVFVALGVAATGGTAGAPGDATGGSGVSPVGFEQTEIDPDDVLIETAVDADGNATWEIQYRVRLSSEEEEQAFADLRTDVESNTTTYTGRFRERMTATAAAAENATGRDMAVTNVTVSADRRELPQSYGVLTYRFEWRNFAAVDGDRIVVGDAVDELFLDDDTSLIVSWPEGYRVAETTPAPTETRDDSVVWRGPTDFTEGEPRVSLQPAGVAGGVSLPLLGGVLLAVLGAAAVVAHRSGYVAFGRGGSPDADTGDSAVTAPESDDTSGSQSTTQTAEPADSGGSADVDDAADADASPVDEELLSNEEQVLRLIESNGGRMKQKLVAEELDWTAAKTSQVVTGLRDDDELDGFRLGRENVLSLPDYEATDDGEAADGEEAAGDDGADPDGEAAGDGD